MHCPIPNIHIVLRLQERLYTKRNVNLKACSLLASALSVQEESKAKHPVLKGNDFNQDPYLAYSSINHPGRRQINPQTRIPRPCLTAESWGGGERRVGGEEARKGRGHRERTKNQGHKEKVLEKLGWTPLPIIGRLC